MGTVGSGGQIQRFRCHGSAPMGAVGERAQGFWLGARAVGEIAYMPIVVNELATGVVTTKFVCCCLKQMKIVFPPFLSHPKSSHRD